MESRSFCRTASRSNLRSKVSGFSKTCSANHGFFETFDGDVWWGCNGDMMGIWWDILWMFVRIYRKILMTFCWNVGIYSNWMQLENHYMWEYTADIMGISWDCHWNIIGICNQQSPTRLALVMYWSYLRSGMLMGYNMDWNGLGHCSSNSLGYQEPMTRLYYGVHECLWSHRCHRLTPKKNVWVQLSVGKTIINHPLGIGLYHLFMAKFRVVQYCFAQVIGVHQQPGHTGTLSGDSGPHHSSRVNILGWTESQKNKYGLCDYHCNPCCLWLWYPRRINGSIPISGSTGIFPNWPDLVSLQV